MKLNEVTLVDRDGKPLIKPAVNEFERRQDDQPEPRRFEARKVLANQRWRTVQDEDARNLWPPSAA